MPEQATGNHRKPDLSQIRRFIKPARTERFGAVMKRQKLRGMESRITALAYKNQSFREEIRKNPCPWLLH